MVDKICKVCGEDFKVRPYRVDTALYCSHACRQKGSRKKVERVCEVCECTYLAAPSRNLKYCSGACYHSTMKGENHPTYRGGAAKVKRPRNSYEGCEWRFNVFKKDNFVCQKCGKGGDLNAHHILAYSRYPEHRTVVENGDTLCIACHKEFHSLYGIKSFTDKEYWEWLSET